MNRLSLLALASLVLVSACDDNSGPVVVEPETGNSTEYYDDTEGPYADTETSGYAEDTGYTTGEPPATTGDPPATTGDPPATTGNPPATTGNTTDGGTCLGSGTFIVDLLDRNDQYGHFPYLKLFYAPDSEVEEIFQVDVAPDGTVTIELLPRAEGTGEGHAGIAGLEGTLDPTTCEVAIDTTADFTSDTGPFGAIQVTIAGVLGPITGTPSPGAAITLQGGGIPSGPITYNVEISGEK